MLQQVAVPGAIYTILGCGSPELPSDPTGRDCLLRRGSGGIFHTPSVGEIGRHSVDSSFGIDLALFGSAFSFSCCFGLSPVGGNWDMVRVDYIYSPGRTTTCSDSSTGGDGVEHQLEMN